MGCSSENSKSPFRGLECLRPLERGERCVAVATDPLYRAVSPPVVQVDTQHFLVEAPLRAFTPSPSAVSALNCRKKETPGVSPRSLILSVDPHHPTGLDKTSLVGLRSVNKSIFRT